MIIGRNPWMGARKKGGIKVHALMDAFGKVTEYVPITAAKEHDRQFLYHIKLPSNILIVFDKSICQMDGPENMVCNTYEANALYHVTKIITDNTRKKEA